MLPNALLKLFDLKFEVLKMFNCALVAGYPPERAVGSAIESTLNLKICIIIRIQRKTFKKIDASDWSNLDACRTV